MYRSFGWSFKFLHNRKKNKAKNKLFPVDVCLINKGIATYFSTGILILPSNWSKPLQQIVNHPYGLQRNARLDEIKFKVISKIESTGGDCTVIQLKNIVHKPEVTTFNDFAKSVLADELKISQSGGEGALAISTIKALSYRIDVVSKINPAIKFREFDSDLAYSLVQELRKSQSVNSIKGIIATCTKFLNIAARKKLYTQGNPFSGIKIGGKRAKRRAGMQKKEALSLWEIGRIEKANLSKKYTKTRNCFLFCCYTGLSYVDAQKLRESDIEKSDYWYIRKERQKTGHFFNVNLSLMFWGKGKTMIEENGVNCLKVSFGTARIRIKEMIKILEIDKKIKMHNGRATCANYLRSSRLLVDQEIDFIMGWSEKDQRSDYISIRREKVDKLLKKIFK